MNKAFNNHESKIVQILFLKENEMNSRYKPYENENGTKRSKKKERDRFARQTNRQRKIEREKEKRSKRESDK